MPRVCNENMALAMDGVLLYGEELRRSGDKRRSLDFCMSAIVIHLIFSVSFEIVSFTNDYTNYSYDTLSSNSTYWKWIFDTSTS